MIKLLTSIIGGVAKIVAWLLVKLGLWVPALFSLLFLIVASVTNTEFHSVRAIFYIGLIVTTVFAFVITFLSAFNKFKRKTEKRASSEVESNSAKPVKKEKKVKLIEGAPSDNEPIIEREEVQPVAQSALVQPAPVQPAPQNAPVQSYQVPPQYPQNGYYAQQQNYYQQYQQQYQPQYPQQQTQMQSAPSEMQTNDSGFLRYNSPATPARYDEPEKDDLASEIADRNGFMRYSSPTPNRGFTRFTASDEQNEGESTAFMRFTPEREVAPLEREVKPKIYRTRMDPNLLIYEYPDRLDFYEITPNGRVLRSSEPKK